MFNIQFGGTQGVMLGAEEPVLCTRCAYFLIRLQDDGNYDLFCPAAGQCGFTEPESKKPFRQRPFYHPLEVS